MQNDWSTRAAHVRCVARLTRPLTTAEATRLTNHPQFIPVSDVVTFTCRPEDVEDSEQRLSWLLRSIQEGAEALPAPVSFASRRRR
jgi:hypothetical protein